jgi:hypothetical protein
MIFTVASVGMPSPQFFKPDRAIQQHYFLLIDFTNLTSETFSQYFHIMVVPDPNISPYQEPGDLPPPEIVQG